MALSDLSFDLGFSPEPEPDYLHLLTLDRLDRARSQSDEVDFREAAFRQSLEILIDGDTHRAKRILNLLSDHTTEMPHSAEGMKGASGAPPQPNRGAGGES